MGLCFSSVFFVLFCFVFCLFRAAPMAYGGSQASGPIGTVAADLHHSYISVGSEPRLWPTPQLMAIRILNPLSRARDGTHILMDTGRISQPLNHDGNSSSVLTYIFITSLCSLSTSEHLAPSTYFTLSRNLLNSLSKLLKINPCTGTQPPWEIRHFTFLYPFLPSALLPTKPCKRASSCLC